MISDSTKLLAKTARKIGLNFVNEHDPESRFIKVNSLDLHYMDWGTNGKIPMLLLHGGAQNAHMWDYVGLSFSSDYHVIALDQRGHGDSQWNKDGDYTPNDYLLDLEEFVRLMGWEKFVIVGLSMGGRNAFSYTSKHPDSLYASVIIDVAPRIQKAGTNRIMEFMMGPDELDSVDDFVMRVLEYNPRRDFERTKGSILNNLKQLPNGKWTWKYDKIFRDRSRNKRIGSSWQEEPLWELIDKITAPTLIVRGAQSDVITLETADEMHARINNSKLATVSRAGHQVPGDNPLEFDSVLREFLSEVLPK